MSKYRIVEKHGFFKVQRKVLLWWVDWSEHFIWTHEEALNTMRAWEREDSLKAKTGWREVK